jgi:hypothetical protein
MSGDKSLMILTLPSLKISFIFDWSLEPTKYDFPSMSTKTLERPTKRLSEDSLVKSFDLSIGKSETP